MTPRTGFPTLAAPDADLIGRHLADRSGPAFAALVRRHGPTVLGVCRRVTGDPHDADDAFQATFLVLARKAHRMAFHADLGGWLVAVAVRCGKELVRRRARRHAREGNPLPDVPATPAHADPDSCRAVLAEVARLAPAYRDAVVLCELEGQSRAAAANRLGVPEGTLSSRLAAARKQLARRLTARGLAPLGVLAVAVPAALAGRAAAVGTASVAPSRSVIELTEAVMRTRTLGRLAPAVAAVLAAVGLVAAGDKPAADAKGDPKPAASHLLVRVMPAVVLPKGDNHAIPLPIDMPGAEFPVRKLRPDGTADGEFVLKAGAGREFAFFGCGPGKPIVSAGRAAYQTRNPIPRPTTEALASGKPVAFDPAAMKPTDSVIAPLAGDGPRLALPIHSALPVAFAPDGAVIGTDWHEPPTVFDDPVYRTFRIDPTAGTWTRLDLPANARVWGVFPDGKSYLASIESVSILGDSRYLAKVTPGKKPEPLTPRTMCPVQAAAVSPDGAKVAYLLSSVTDALVPDPKPNEWGAFVVAVGGKPTRLPIDMWPASWFFGVGLAWSPDGKRVAVSHNRMYQVGDDPKQAGGRITVCDADGRNKTSFRGGDPVPNALAASVVLPAGAVLAKEYAAEVYPFVSLLGWK